VRYNSVFVSGPERRWKDDPIKVLTGLIFPTSGTVQVLGGAPSDSAVRARSATAENPSPRPPDGSEILISLPALHVPHQQIAAEIQRTLALDDLKRAANVQVRKYSRHGAAAGIAQGVAGKPELDILDDDVRAGSHRRRPEKDLNSNLRARARRVLLDAHHLRRRETSTRGASSSTPDDAVGAGRRLIGGPARWR
jgi:ABC-2 type transport system ATP-binding protein